MVLRGPRGEVVRSFSSGASGYFDHNGKKLTFSAKTAIEYDGDGQNVCILYEKPQESRFVEGAYAVTLYSGGYLIGQSEFKVD
jgi:hypothetical protein